MYYGFFPSQLPQFSAHLIPEFYRDYPVYPITTPTPLDTETFLLESCTEFQALLFLEDDRLLERFFIGWSPQCLSMDGSTPGSVGIEPMSKVIRLIVLID